MEQGASSVPLSLSPLSFLCLFFSSPKARKSTLCLWMSPDYANQPLKDILATPKGTGL